MMGAHAFGHKLGLSPMSHAVPIVFVVDDDVSVRESLELLIRCEGWLPETFASAEDFLSRPRVFAPSCLVLDVSLPDLNGLLEAFSHEPEIFVIHLNIPFIPHE